MVGWLPIRSVILYYIIFILSVSGRPRDRNFRIIIDKFELKKLIKEYFKDLQFKLTQTGNGSYLDSYMILTRNVDNIQIDLQLDMLRNHKQRMRLIDVHMNDACRFYDTVHKNPLVNILARQLIDVTSGKFKCPLVKNFNYTFHNWHIRESDFPTYVPNCKLLGSTKFYTDKKLALTMSFFARVINKN